MPCEVEQTAVPTATESALKLNLPEGIPPLTTLYLYISDSCNLACKHCWITPTFDQGADNGQHIELSYVKKALQEARPLGLRSVKLTGGEPTIHPQFRDIVSMIADEGFRIIIETNGILCGRELVQFLKEKSPNSFISVSVDGAAADTHDSLRGVKGSHKQALSGIRNLVQSGFRPQMICTLHKGNISHAEEVLALAEKLGCGSIKFNHVQQIGHGEYFAESNGLKLIDIIDNYQKIESKITPQSKIKISFDIPHSFFSIRKFLKNPLSRCAILNIIGLLSGGELALCGIGVTLPELIFGNIKTDNLKQVWLESEGLMKLRELIPLQLEGICGKCIHRNICLGHCIANNYYRVGKLNAPYYFCDQANNLGVFPNSRKLYQ